MQHKLPSSVADKLHTLQTGVALLCALRIAFNVDSVDNSYAMNASNDKIRGYKTYGKRRSLRLQHFDYSTPHVYHMTWGTVDRKPVLSDLGIVTPLVEELEREAKNGKMLLYAYCFMPDHVHILLSPKGEQDVVSFVQAYKSKTTRLYWQAGNRGKLWQHGFYDRIMRQKEDIRQVAKYILANPVRKGLIDDFREYPFSGSLVFKKEDL